MGFFIMSQDGLLLSKDLDRFSWHQRLNPAYYASNYARRFHGCKSACNALNQLKLKKVRDIQGAKVIEFGDRDYINYLQGGISL